jgi:hypothetical protein
MCYSQSLLLQEDLSIAFSCNKFERETFSKLVDLSSIMHQLLFSSFSLWNLVLLYSLKSRWIYLHFFKKNFICSIMSRTMLILTRWGW